MKKILLAVTKDNYPEVITPETEAGIRELGEVVKRDDLKEADDPQTAYVEAIRAARPEIVVTGWGSPTLTMEAYRASPDLAYMCHCAGTVRNYVDRDVLASGLLVSNWGRLPAPTVAEASLMMTLACLRKVSGYVRLLDDGGWGAGEFESASLFGRSVGLHGLGVIAQEFVRLLAPFDCDISAFSPHCPDEVFEELGVAREEDLANLYAANDVVSIHASKTPKNHHIVDADILAGMKDGAVLVNTARGAIIDTEALVEKLEEGTIWAALDVFEQEPLPADSPLRGMRNVLLLPHQAGPTPDWQPRMGRHALENLSRYVAGEDVTDVVTVQKYDLIT